jgi:hypothetical protein
MPRGKPPFRFHVRSVAPIPQEVGWVTSTGSYGDVSFRSSTALTHRDPYGISILLGHHNSTMYTSMGDSYLEWIDDYSWGSYVEAGDLIISPSGSFAIDRNTLEPVWQYENADFMPPWVHAYYDESHIVINPDYILLIDDWEATLVIMRTTTGEVLYEDMPPEAVWYYYTSWHPLPANNEWLMVAETTDYPYYRTYIMSIDEGGTVSVDPHPHSSVPPFEEDKELFARPWNYNPVNRILIDRRTNDYYYMNSVYSSLGSVISKFNSSHQLQWTCDLWSAVSSPANEILLYGHMSLAADRLLVIGPRSRSGTPGVRPVLSINRNTGDDLQWADVSASDWNQVSHTTPNAMQHILKPKSVLDNHTNIPVVLQFDASVGSGYWPQFGLINTDTLALTLISDRLDQDPNFGDNPRLDGLQEHYYGLLQSDAAGNYFALVFDNSDFNYPSKLVTVNASGVQSIVEVDYGGAWWYGFASPHTSMFGDGERTGFGANPGTLARSGPTAHTIPTGRSVSLVKDEWYVTGNSTWDPGLLPDQARYAPRAITSVGPLYGGDFIPVSSQRFLNRDTGKMFFIPDPYNSNTVFTHIRQFDEDHFIITQGNVTLIPKLFNTSTGVMTDADMDWPPPSVPSGWQRREAYVHPNGNIVVAYQRGTGTDARIQLYEWNGISWDTKTLGPSALSTGSSPGLNVRFTSGSNYFVAHMVADGNTRLYQYTFTLDTWTHINTVTTGMPVTEYGDPGGTPLTQNQWGFWMGDSATYVYRSNTMRFGVVGQTFDEIPLSVEGNPMYTLYASTPGGSFGTNANMVIFEDFLYRVDLMMSNQHIVHVMPIEDDLTSPY